MRLLVLAMLAALLCGACASTAGMASGGLTDEQICAMNRGMWRAGHCEACGGGM